MIVLFGFIVLFEPVFDLVWWVVLLIACLICLICFDLLFGCCVRFVLDFYVVVFVAF